MKSGGGIGILFVLGFLFVVMKLGGVIAWPWWVVLAPIWGFAVLLVITMGSVWVYLMRREYKKFKR